VITVALPSLTPEQRAAALEKAAAARRRRAEAKKQLKYAQLSLSQLIDDAVSDEALAKMRVSELLEALPGVGRIKAQAIMADVGISEGRRVRGLGAHQRDTLLERFG